MTRRPRRSASARAIRRRSLRPRRLRSTRPLAFRALINAYGDSSKTALDSALKYQTLMTSVPARVTFNEFTPGDNKVTLGGSVTNQTEAAQSFTLKIDFIDKAGNVVSSQTVDVPGVDPKRSKPFRVDGTGAGIIAFRYAPIT